MCHRFLPIDRYNGYQSNQIYRSDFYGFIDWHIDTDFYRLTNPGTDRLFSSSPTPTPLRCRSFNSSLFLFLSRAIGGLFIVFQEKVRGLWTGWYEVRVAFGRWSHVGSSWTVFICILCQYWREKTMKTIKGWIEKSEMIVREQRKSGSMINVQK